MKSRDRIAMSAVALLALLGVLLWCYFTDPEKPAIDRLPGKTLKGPAASAVGSSNSGSLKKEPAQSLSSSLPPSVAPTQSSLNDKVTRLQLAASQMNVPISFWGLVVDQDNRPLAGARVVMSIRQWHATSLSDIDAAFIRREVHTDGGGRFALADVSGDNVTLEIVEKEGYRLSPKAQKTFSYGQSPEPHSANPAQPFVIRMWKAQPSDLLRSFTVSRLIPYDGSAVWVDLLEGRLSEGTDPAGDLKITLEREPRDIPLARRDPFDWRATIEASSGGLKLAEDEFMYFAPADGYQDRVQIEMPATAQDWKPSKQVSLYVKARDGRCYARVTLDFRANYSGEKTGFTVEAAVNPTGSRNLEP
ncbi:MAG: carboxypeptidase regulatory-like domain-containing protein [Verrucomicrobia bacterium]|nr:carboxypeptidase regulatory-like domain-containing protein [Verrucomicrobiota bacterium]